MTGHRIKGSPCPHCGAMQDGATQINGNDTPRKGDIGICFDCATLSIYGDDLVRRFPNEREQRIISDDPQLRQLVNAARLALAERRPEPE